MRKRKVSEDGLVNTAVRSTNAAGITVAYFMAS